MNEEMHMADIQKWYIGDTVVVSSNGLRLRHASLIRIDIDIDIDMCYSYKELPEFTCVSILL